jgi:rhamnose utilization protein RhaD (predicted bifunctional aldolase and dehydrogenase)
MGDNNNKDFCLLHNVAITLLQRIQYRASIETFLDALTVYQYYSELEENQHHHTNDPSTNEVPISNHNIVTSSSSNIPKYDDMIVIIEQMKHRALKQLALSERKSNDESKCDDVSIDPLIVLNVTDNDDECLSFLMKNEASIDKIDFMMRVKDLMLLSSVGKVEDRMKSCN